MAPGNEKTVPTDAARVAFRRKMIEARMALANGRLPSTRPFGEELATTPAPTKRQQTALLRKAVERVFLEHGGRAPEQIVRSLLSIATNPDAGENSKLQQGAIMAAQLLSQWDRSLGKDAQEEAPAQAAPQITVVFQERPGGRPLPERNAPRAGVGRTIDMPKREIEE